MRGPWTGGYTLPTPDVGPWGAIGKLELPIVIIELDHFTVLALSSSFAAHVGLKPDEMIGKPILNLLADPDRADATLALEALRGGVIDFYRAHPKVRGADEQPVLGTAWVHAVEWGAKRVAVVEARMGNGPTDQPLGDYLHHGSLDMVIGTMDEQWVISVVSNDIKAALGISAEDAIGRTLTDLVHGNDENWLRDAWKMATVERAVSIRVTPRHDGGWEQLCCLLSCLAGSQNRAFILIRLFDVHRDSTDQTSRLERHLWNIAAEVEASGILQRLGKTPNLAELPKMQLLSVRQWDIVNRLLQGERVATIAKELFVSEGTVRNHLSKVFERFGVHSQAELLKVLREMPGAGSQDG